MERRGLAKTCDDININLVICEWIRSSNAFYLVDIKIDEPVNFHSKQ